MFSRHERAKLEAAAGKRSTNQLLGVFDGSTDVLFPDRLVAGPLPAQLNKQLMSGEQALYDRLLYVVAQATTKDGDAIFFAGGNLVDATTVRSIKPHTQLNDTAVMAAMWAIEQMCPHVGIIDSLVLKNVNDKTGENRLGGKVLDRLKKPLVLVVHHTPGHWTLSAINSVNRTLHYMDSYFDHTAVPPDEVARVAKLYARHGLSFDFTLEVMPVARQESVDCGVHVVMNALLAVNGVQPPLLPYPKEVIYCMRARCILMPLLLQAPSATFML